MTIGAMQEFDVPANSQASLEISSAISISGTDELSKRFFKVQLMKFLSSYLKNAVVPDPNKVISEIQRISTEGKVSISPGYESVVTSIIYKYYPASIPKETPKETQPSQPAQPATEEKKFPWLLALICGAAVFYFWRK